ncbi:hypothetical protein LCGC14_0471080 [marine sediment metagenome]|uniref:Succinylglutamate desuccinylase n=1 Tax=marine sediment metagenome TaxID=412755 RepID=A0A0F9VL26_9ZZZZ|nr:DUF1826 domain-containing protein [Methylophaga sp.]HEC58880.1 DUF1826 domain-containing protein [Methylophaga sp.]
MNASSLKINNDEFDTVCSANDPAILAEIYQESVNLCIWQRQLSKSVTDYVDWLLATASNRELRIIAESNDVISVILNALPAHDGLSALAGDINVLATMFADLFDLKRIGIRLSILDRNMCPRFHTDNLPCRLVSTYAGSGTQWLPEYSVDRSKLGHGAGGVPDKVSGIYSHLSHIQQFNAGDVGLLKGAGWLGNETRAIVHRSPEIATGDKRLLLTLDFGD